MDKLIEIEKRLNIKFPELYKRLYKDGMLNWGGGKQV